MRIGRFQSGSQQRPRSNVIGAGDVVASKRSSFVSAYRVCHDHVFMIVPGVVPSRP
jgi:hypothetical protein